MRTWWRIVTATSLAGTLAFADEPAPAPAAPARPTADAARAGARSWLGALRDKLPERIARFTAFPLAIEGIAPRSGPEAKKCRLVQAAKDAKALDGVAKCLFAAKEFMDDIPADLALAQWKVVEAGEAPAAFDKKREKLTALGKDHVLVQVDLTGEALNYTLLLAVKQNGSATAVSMVLADGKKPE